MTSTRTERDAFLEAICQTPEDDTPRLVYADWLEEHGDGESDATRARFIRTQIEELRFNKAEFAPIFDTVVELGRCEDKPNTFTVDPETPEGREFIRCENRLKLLRTQWFTMLQKHVHQWLDGIERYLLPDDYFQRGSPWPKANLCRDLSWVGWVEFQAEWRWGGHLHELPRSPVVCWRRGFIQQMRIHGRPYQMLLKESIGEIFRRCPIERVRCIYQPRENYSEPYPEGCSYIREWLNDRIWSICSHRSRKIKRNSEVRFPTRHTAEWWLSQEFSAYGRRLARLPVKEKEAVPTII